MINEHGLCKGIGRFKVSARQLSLPENKTRRGLLEAEEGEATVVFNTPRIFWQNLVKTIRNCANVTLGYAAILQSSRFLPF